MVQKKYIFVKRGKDGRVSHMRRLPGTEVSRGAEMIPLGKKYYIKNNNRKIYFNDIPNNTRFMSGFENEKNRGKAFLYLNTDEGIKNKPLFFTHNNKQVTINDI